MPIRLITPRDPGVRRSSGLSATQNADRPLAFARSAAFEKLRLGLMRYCSFRTAGRSYVISGDRGIGKTTTVLAALEVVRAELESHDGQLRLAENDSPPAARPFLVRISGPDILLEEKARRQVAATANTQDAASKQGEPGTAAPPSSAEEILVRHFARVLHSSLAEEIVDLFRARIADKKGPFRVPAAELYEAAAQLSLELHDDTSVESLMRFWRLGGWLESGVVPYGSKPPDQGMRELVAIDCSNLAYRIATGRVVRSVSNTDQQQQANPGMTGEQWRQIVTGAVSIAGGATTAAGLLTRAQTLTEGFAAALGGVVAALAFSSAMGATRTVSRNRSENFVDDTGPMSLSWRLPLVIDRLFDAGLAPVFLVDELDKAVEL